MKRDPKRKRIMILGGGPNRIGQGIEFDYCCCQAAFALCEEGFESVMVNSNPETVSTDYDTSDRLFFEPLTVEDVLNIHERMKPEGVIVQFGGQTPLNLARALEAAGVKIIGTSPDSIDLAEDRDRFQGMLRKIGLRQPENGIARDTATARLITQQIGYPVLVRPSYVLGGRAMRIVYDEVQLAEYVDKAIYASPDQSLLIDKFLEDATEVDVDALSDGEKTIVCGVMEHIEEAGIHSGDSACALPPYSLSKELIAEIKKQTYALARELKVIGLMNIQFAIKGGEIYVLEVNPRASRTVPFVSKATGIPIPKMAAKVMLGRTLDDLGLTKEPWPRHISVKESCFPFVRFPGVDIILGPEMRSTGEVMGVDKNFAMAFAKSQLAVKTVLPKTGKIFMSFADRDKDVGADLASQFHGLGFEILSTPGTAKIFREHGVPVTQVFKVQQGRPNIIDYMKNDEVGLIVNTPSGPGAHEDERKIRGEAVARGVACVTTISAARVVVQAINAMQAGEDGSQSLAGLVCRRQGITRKIDPGQLRKSADSKTPHSISLRVRNCPIGILHAMSLLLFT